MARRDTERRARYVRGKALATAADGAVVFHREIEAAAARIAEELANRPSSTPELGFWDDIVDVVNAVGDVTEEILAHVAGATEEITHITEQLTEESWVTVLTAVLFEAAALEQQVEGASKPHQASAEQLLAARQALLTARDRQRKLVAEMVEIVRSMARGATED
jgi:hypothetical protein